MLSESLCRLVSNPFCMGLYIVRHSISLGLTSVLYESLCFNVPWSKFHSVLSLYVVRLSISLGFTSVLYGSLCCSSPYVAWSHFRSVWISLLSGFLRHVVSRPYCMGPYLVPVSVTWSHLCAVWVSMLSVFLCRLVSITFCMYLYVVRVSMSLGLTSVLHGSLCCPCFYVTWSHVRYVCISMLSVFLCHLVSRPFCMCIYVVWVSIFYLYARVIMLHLRRIVPFSAKFLSS
jgi:hypothetical protein